VTHPVWLVGAASDRRAEAGSLRRPAPGSVLLAGLGKFTQRSLPGSTRPGWPRAPPWRQPECDRHAPSLAALETGIVQCVVAMPAL
jgi:hypothetical protein